MNPKLDIIIVGVVSVRHNHGNQITALLHKPTGKPVGHIAGLAYGLLHLFPGSLAHVRVVCQHARNRGGG